MSNESILAKHQWNALARMKNGCILNGGVGSGKTRTGAYYYFQLNGGSYIGKEYKRMINPQDLYIFTTAAVRDKHEWEKELSLFRLSPDPECSLYKSKVVIDSWNNIAKYKHIKGAFVIFDEDRVKGDGVWVKAFLEIAKNNRWIILSATPGDKWEDYRPVFIANGFYKNKTEFNNMHIEWDPRCRNFPKVKGYHYTSRLIRLRDSILIDMDIERHTVRHDVDIFVDYDKDLYKDTWKNRTDPYNQGYIPCTEESPGSLLIDRDISLEDVDPRLDMFEWEPQRGAYVRWAKRPLDTASGLCYTIRRIMNEDEERQKALLELYEEHPKMIVFYNYDYERDILLNLGYGPDVEVAEWNGHNHEPLPTGDKWVYIVQYVAGCEGWNAITTDTIVFYSQTYSYTQLEQARGRIDRMNTPFVNLWYYHIKCRAPMDIAIARTLREKKKFNEGKFVGTW